MRKIICKILFILLFSIIIYFTFSVNVYGSELKDYFGSEDGKIKVVIVQSGSGGVVVDALEGDYDDTPTFDFTETILDPLEEYQIFITYRGKGYGVDNELGGIEITRFGDNRGEEVDFKFIEEGTATSSLIDWNSTDISAVPEGIEGYSAQEGLPFITLNTKAKDDTYERDNYMITVRGTASEPEKRCDFGIIVKVYYEEEPEINLDRNFFSSGKGKLKVTLEQESDGKTICESLEFNLRVGAENNFDFSHLELDPTKDYKVYITYSGDRYSIYDKFESINIRRIGFINGFDKITHYAEDPETRQLIDQDLTGMCAVPDGITEYYEACGFPCIVLNASAANNLWNQERYEITVTTDRYKASYEYDFKIILKVYYPLDSVELDFIDATTTPYMYKPTEIDDRTADKVEKKISKILTSVNNVGMVLAIVMLAILGVKYMLGGIEEKADFKKDLVPYFIGAILLFGITTFVNIFMKWGDKISSIVG